MRKLKKLNDTNFTSYSNEKVNNLARIMGGNYDTGQNEATYSKGNQCDTADVWATGNPGEVSDGCYLNWATKRNY